MSSPQADALIDEIARRAALQERERLDAAARDADALRRRAAEQALRQLRRTADELRAARRRHEQQQRAEIETQQRRRLAQRAAEALAAAWPLLADALARRWRDAAARAAWIDALLALAHARLPARGWRIAHPQAGWSDADTAALRARLAALGVADGAALHADAAVEAGLVIDVDGARIDGRPQALLRDRARVDAELLAALAADAPDDGAAR